MADFGNNVTICVRPMLMFDDETANLCLRIVEHYVNQHDELRLSCDSDGEGGVSFSFKRWNDDGES